MTAQIGCPETSVLRNKPEERKWHLDVINRKKITLRLQLCHQSLCKLQELSMISLLQKQMCRPTRQAEGC